MSSSRRKRAKRNKIILATSGAVALAAVASAVTFAAVQAHEPEAVSDKVASYYANPPKVESRGPEGMLAVVGDSFSVDKPTAWMHPLAKCLNYNLTVSGVGGSGFFAPGKDVPFGDPKRMEPIVTAKPNLVIFETAYNDSWRAEWDPATITAKATETISAYQKALPKAKFVLVGPFWAQRPIPARMENNRKALIDTAKATKVTYLDALEWLPSTEYTGNDKLHPNDKGNVQIKDKLVEELTKAKVISGCSTV